MSYGQSITYQYSIINIPKKRDIKNPSLFFSDQVLHPNPDTLGYCSETPSLLSSSYPSSSLSSFPQIKSSPLQNTPPSWAKPRCEDVPHHWIPWGQNPLVPSVHAMRLRSLCALHLAEEKGVLECKSRLKAQRGSEPVGFFPACLPSPRCLRLQAGMLGAVMAASGAHLSSVVIEEQTKVL